MGNTTHELYPDNSDRSADEAGMVMGATLIGLLAVHCAPWVAPSTLAAIAGTESGFNPLEIHDNTAGKTWVSASRTTAIDTARQLIATGHSVDLGLMQINSTNLIRLGLTVRTAFNACASLGAAGRLLAMDYRPTGSTSTDQAALQVAFSRYNTGSPVQGFQNGYVQRVVATARHIVPAINPDAPVMAPTSPVRAPALTPTKHLPPHWPHSPHWHVFATAPAAHAAGTAIRTQVPHWNIFPRSVGPARLARHRTVTITAHPLSHAGTVQPQPGTSHAEHSD